MRYTVRIKEILRLFKFYPNLHGPKNSPLYGLSLLSLPRIQTLSGLFHDLRPRTHFLSPLLLIQLHLI